MGRRKHWGWGHEDDAWSVAQLRAAAPGLEEHLRIAGDGEVREPVALRDVVLRAPRVAAPPALAPICSADVHSRASHAWGKSYADVVRGFHGRFDFPPDLVARPRGERDVEAVLEWAAGANVAVVAYGGGTSVTGGVTCDVPDRFDGRRLARPRRDGPRAADRRRVARGAHPERRVGTGLERQLRAMELTLRFYPQSFELSTLGGWIATRAGGHFATAETHIDDLVESVRAITPRGAWQSRRVPGSGAGISPDRMLLGSEGILGVVTEAWVRVRPRPLAQSLAAVRFASFERGIDALRAIAQSGLRPSNCRLIDAEEARMTGAADGTAALLVLGFEGSSEAVLPVGELLDRGAARLRRGGRRVGRRAVRRPRFTGDPSGSGDAVGAWRAAFFRAPYLRDAFVAMGHPLRDVRDGRDVGALRGAARGGDGAAAEAIGPAGRVTCRISHVYPDGPAPYFTVLAPARRGDEVAQWAADQARRQRRAARRRRHDHPPPRGRARPPAVVRPPAPRRLRRRAGRREARRRPGRRAQPRRADRRLRGRDASRGENRPRWGRCSPRLVATAPAGRYG